MLTEIANIMRIAGRALFMRIAKLKNLNNYSLIRVHDSHINFGTRHNPRIYSLISTNIQNIRIAHIFFSLG